MKVHVTRVDTSTEDVIVDFTCEFGKAEAFWGTKPIPKANHDYEVELDISEELSWGEDVKPSKENRFGIYLHGDFIILIGILEKVYKDGMADFRIGKSLIQLELDGNNLPVGSYITVRCASVELYEVNY